MASDVTVNKAVQSQLKTLNGNAQLAEDFDDFLRLLTTQLQNQDPLSPLDTNEFTSQLVQFAGVEQQINMNQKLNDLVSLGIGTSFSGALSYVGLDVSYLSSELNFDGSTPVKIDYAIDGVPKEAAVNIYDGTGALVRKAGVMAIVLASGEVRAGDAVGVHLPEGAHRALEPV